MQHSAKMAFIIDLALPGESKSKKVTDFGKYSIHRFTSLLPDKIDIKYPFSTTVDRDVVLKR